jgi:ABC-2 type transport system permease protein
MSFIAAFKLYYVRKLNESLHNPAMLSISVFVPLMYLSLFAPLLKHFTGMPGFESGNILNTFLPGVLVSLSVFGGAYTGFRLIDEIRQGIVERFRVTPTSRIALLLGAVVRDVTNVLAQSLIFTAAAIPFGLEVHLTGLLLLLLLLAMNTALFASFSYAIALRFQNEDTLIPFAQVVTLPGLLLAGFLLPINLAPGWLKVASHFDPLYYSVEASRALINGRFGQASVWQSFAVTHPQTGLVVRWAGSLFKRVVN